MKNNLEPLEDSSAYEAMPYENQSCLQSHPYHLMTLGVLFGVNAVKPEQARVLELGCATGWNILPHAVNYPEAEFIGVDLSKVQIDKANKYAIGLGLKNIKFHHCSITDIDESWGKFDYIIANGILSWVSDAIRDKIFEICNKNLSENGIAYISYNTLPGWNSTRNAIDIMTYSTRNYKNIQERIVQSKACLQFIADSVVDQDAAYTQSLHLERDIVENLSNFELKSNYLGEINRSFYFNEFIAEANKYNLQYLTDSSLFTMSMKGTPAEITELLKGDSDAIEKEQYIDFIINRRHRESLLCHAKLALSLANNDRLKQFNMTCNVLPTKHIDDIDINNDSERIEFVDPTNNNLSLSTASPYLKAVLYSFADCYDHPLSFDELTMMATQKLKKFDNNILEKVQDRLLNNLMGLVSQGYVNITLQYFQVPEPNLDKPCLTKIALYQVRNTQNGWVTNLKHGIVNINELEIMAMQYMDGKLDRKEILERVLINIKEKDLTLTDTKNETLKDESVIRQQVSIFLDDVYNTMLNNSLLI
ncbi:Methyltransferase domain protein [Candidatus Trichorickettsia mobilis]|uniref:Methyltransferase domain protein n=1 Tax=Candidatus Trichorickettsia mobilis TaxID=1346319 RepID=A0ABZ0URD8_9RICK|nr:class I SAM-dependent methyltransferase [Candidatus Trichorickettsia mobilis]WPY00208.1 Methyltransferase domain protein [Candidatus Trichorickettsia mobilis]